MGNCIPGFVVKKKAWCLPRDFLVRNKKLAICFHEREITFPRMPNGQLMNTWALDLMILNFSLIYQTFPFSFSTDVLNVVHMLYESERYLEEKWFAFIADRGKTLWIWSYKNCRSVSRAGCKVNTGYEDPKWSWDLWEFIAPSKLCVASITVRAQNKVCVNTSGTFLED